MNILFLSGIYADNTINSFSKLSKRGFQFAAQNLQNALLNGFIQNNISISVLSFPFLSTFPMGYKRPVVKTSPFFYAGEEMGWSIGKLNLPIIGFPFNYKDKIRRWYNSNAGPKYIFVYSLHANLMSIAFWAKRQYKDIILCILVADLPEYMASNRIYQFLGLQKKDNEIINKLLPKFNKIILLSPNMSDKLPVDRSQCTVMEGIYIDDNSEEVVEKEDNPTILYTGNLGERYCIKELLDAFEGIKDNNFKLWIRGNGECEEEVKRRASKDKRIQYYDRMPRSALLNLERRATILINPVFSSQEFTKYFFPSKTMEYLASGTPTIMCNLSCLPEEYLEHIIQIKTESTEGIRNAIVDTCKKSKEDLRNFGNVARHFIMSEKTPQKQVRRILDFIIQ